MVLNNLSWFCKDTEDDLSFIRVQLIECAGLCKFTVPKNNISDVLFVKSSAKPYHLDLLFSFKTLINLYNNQSSSCCT